MGDPSISALNATLMRSDRDDLEIVDIEAFPVSVALDNGSRLAIGRAVKRDAVVVKVTTACGIIGWGEAHHARAADVVAAIVNTTVRDILIPGCALDVVSLWDRLYTWQLRSHGLGAAAVIAMSGVDMALWDIRGKACAWPVYRLLGGSPTPIPAYAGGVALGWQDTSSLIDEIAPLIERGYRAVKLRVGEGVHADIERVAAVRSHFGSDLTILTDANTGYDIDLVRQIAPSFEQLGVAWLEEPFPAHDYRAYQAAARLTTIPLAAGENHYTRFEFTRVLDDGSITMLQPDVAKAGGITEVHRIAATASSWKRRISPHSSVTGLSQVASIHVLMAIDNAGYFEADVTPEPDFREQLTSTPWSLAPDGTVVASELPGLGVEVDEEFVRSHSFISGKNFV